MNLGNLLHELRFNILHDRSDQVSGANDYLWDDKTLVLYIDAAHRRFARKAQVIRDGTNPQVTQVRLKTGETMYPLHPSVISVLSARAAGDTADLARAGHSYLDTYTPADSYYFDPAMLAQQPPGKALAFSTDEYQSLDDDGSNSIVTMRIWPQPTADQNGRLIQLRVVRLPIDHFTVDNLKAEPEIPEDFHLPMLDWAAYLALRVEDVDKGNPERAAEFKATFEAHITDAQQNARKKSLVQPKFGFGRGGFTWER